MKSENKPIAINSITSLELEELIRFQLTTLWKLSEKETTLSSYEIAAKVPPILVWGPPGVGKSSVIRSLCEEYQIGFLDIRLAQREPIDLRGLPVPTENGMVQWLISSEWPRDHASKGIIIFDELTAADRTLQVAAYELILDRRLGDLYQIPPGWFVIAAGNRVTDKAVAVTLSSALANRFLHVELEPDVESWVQWALRNDIHPDVIGFVRFKTELFHSMDYSVQRGWPSARSWERVSGLLNQQKMQPISTRLRDIYIDGLVGSAAGIEFKAFLEWSNELVNTYELMTNPSIPIKIPTRADQRYALSSSLGYHVWRGKTQQEADLLLDGFFRISIELTSDFATLAMIDAMHGKNASKREEYSKKLLHHPLFGKWREKHGESLNSRMRKK